MMIQKCEFSIGNVNIEIVMQGGFSEKGRATSTYMHCHPNLEVHYIVEGKYNFRCEDRDVTLFKDNLVVVPPKLYHAFSSTSDNRKILSFEIRLRKRKKGSDLYQKYDELISSIAGAKIFSERIPEFLSISESMGIIVGDEEICKINSYFTLAFIKICDLLKSDTSVGEVNNTSRTACISPSDDDLTVIRIFEIINKKYREALTLGEVAKSVNLSERQVQRILLVRMGEGFHDILTKNRINASKEIIAKDTKKSKNLGEIATECGYSNYVSFWSHFKRLTGQTPEQYRAEHLLL
jgi:YesN/AraC family two-component response regulator